MMRTWAEAKCGEDGRHPLRDVSHRLSGVTRGPTERWVRDTQARDRSTRASAGVARLPRQTRSTPPLHGRLKNAASWHWRQSQKPLNVFPTLCKSTCCRLCWTHLAGDDKLDITPGTHLVLCEWGHGRGRRANNGGLSCRSGQCDDDVFDVARRTLHCSWMGCLSIEM